jgi:hypothetical protein
MAGLSTEIEIEPQPFAIVRAHLPANRRRDQSSFVSVRHNLSELEPINAPSLVIPKSNV